MQVLVGGRPAKGARFHRRVAVPAVDAELIDVVPVAERNGLGSNLVLPGNVGGRAEVENDAECGLPGEAPRRRCSP